MYINSISIENFRTFRKTQVSFCHAEQDFEAIGIPAPRLKNLNLVLADNGHGKTSLLKAIALAALGPAAGHSGIYPYRLVRREFGRRESKRAVLKASFTTHDQDDAPFTTIESHVDVVPEGDIELIEWKHPQEKRWHPIFSSKSDAFF